LKSEQPQLEFKSYAVTPCSMMVWPPIVSSGWASSTLSDFSYPWEKETPPRMLFSAQHDRDWLYCLFEVRDQNIQVFVDSNTKDEVILGDRVEIFLRQDESMSLYYGLEVDFHGRVYDYRASYHRQFDPQWAWPVGHLKVKAHRTPDGYWVALAISKESLTQLGLLKNNQLQAGLFRGQCISRNTMRWISWATPESPTPDFHIPSAFGIFTIES
jgi:Carbohydrate family 9 binding domain-like